ncbi:hypothetical protein AAFF_G00058330 [Aldrovandia affinis]|uniref:Uncharacterized protein n=1 Tax=Aldrovandia affinis TaxID=143900 RepID=A0AAD7WF33_9TELE|nr:hypothetical protein AAFF_G00058330 [Aldrovandia affinis]
MSLDRDDTFQAAGPRTSIELPAILTSINPLRIDGTVQEVLPTLPLLAHGKRKDAALLKERIDSYIRRDELRPLKSRLLLLMRTSAPIESPGWTAQGRTKKTAKPLQLSAQIQAEVFCPMMHWHGS